MTGGARATVFAKLTTNGRDERVRPDIWGANVPWSVNIHTITGSETCLPSRLARVSEPISPMAVDGLGALGVPVGEIRLGGIDHPLDQCRPVTASIEVVAGVESESGGNVNESVALLVGTETDVLSRRVQLVPGRSARVPVGHELCSGSGDVRTGH